MKTSTSTSVSSVTRSMSFKNATIIENKIIFNERSHKQADYICKLINDKLATRAYRIDYNAVIIPSGFDAIQESDNSITVRCTEYNELLNGRIIAIRS